MKIREWFGSHILCTCRLATGVGFMGFSGGFFSFILLVLFLSHHHQNKPVTGFRVVYFSSLKLYKHSPVKAAAW